MSYPPPQNIKVSAFEAPVVTLTMKPALTVPWTGGTTFILNVKTEDNRSYVIQSTSYTVTDFVNGVATFPLTSPQTGQRIGPGTYKYDIWRTDAGNEKRLAYGTLIVLPEQWQ